MDYQLSFLGPSDIAERLTASHRRHGAAVLVPLVKEQDGWSVLFELRSRKLSVQPGEVSLPGGAIEEGESPLEAAQRECSEELCISPEQIHIIAELGSLPGPGASSLFAFVGSIDSYNGSFSPDEVERTFTVPLDWLAKHPPQEYDVRYIAQFSDDFPFEKIPQGRSYPFMPSERTIPFYMESDPLIWGATARVVSRFVSALTDNYAQ